MALNEERAARNETVFRAANELLRERTRELADLERRPYLCECSDPRCTDVLLLTEEEYRAARSHPRRFLVVRGHAHEGEVVVDAADGHELVEKPGPGR